MKDKGRDRGSQFNEWGGCREGAMARDGGRGGSRRPQPGQRCTSGGTGRAEGNRCYLQASAGPSVSRWRRAQAAGQSDAVAPTPAGRGAWKGLQPLTES